MTVIWRRRNVLNWIVSTAVADGPTPIWHQDILNRHGEIGQLHIYRYANLFQSCPVASGALRKTVALFNARELRNLWNYAFCKGVSWLFGQCWIQCHCHEFSINQEKTSLQMDVTAAMLSLSLYWIILHHFFAFLWLHRCIVCNDCNAAYSHLMLFLWSVIECYLYSLWHYINLDILFPFH